MTAPAAPLIDNPNGRPARILRAALPGPTPLSALTRATRRHGPGHDRRSERKRTWLAVTFLCRNGLLAPGGDGFRTTGDGAAALARLAADAAPSPGAPHV